MADQQQEDSQTNFPFAHLATLLGLALLVFILWPDGKPEKKVIILDPPLPGALDTGEKSQQSASDQEALVDKTGNMDEEQFVIDEAGSAVAEMDHSNADTVVSAPEDQLPAKSREKSPVPPEPVASSQQQVKQETVVEEEGSREAEPARPVEAEPLTGLAAELGYQQEDWLLTLDSGGWVLQLLVSSEEELARRTLDKLGVQRSRGAYYRSDRQGKSVYIVVLTGFESRDQARAAVASLPAALQGSNPFPKSISMILKEISG